MNELVDRATTVSDAATTVRRKSVANWAATGEGAGMSQHYLWTPNGREETNRDSVEKHPTMRWDPVVVAYGPTADDWDFWHADPATDGVGWSVNDAGVLTIQVNKGGDVLRVYGPAAYRWVEGPGYTKRPGRMIAG